jgi:hypothetical protein
MYYRFGSKGDKVREIQIALKLHVDGIYGRMTEAAVKNFQIKNGMHPDGVASPDVLNLLLGDNYTTDTLESFYKEGNFIRRWLREGEYIEEPVKKEYIFLHHTAGSYHPFYTIDGWERDKRGRVATEFVIGGRSFLGTNDYDGLIVQAFPDDCWAYHLGVPNQYLEKYSVGIEICNFGKLTEKEGKYFNYLGQEVPEDQVCVLKEEYRGSKYYHNYTEKQIVALERLIKFLADKHSIDLEKGLKTWLKTFSPTIAFDFYSDAIQGKVKGLLSHTNVRKGHEKQDIYPHPGILDMLNRL